MMQTLISIIGGYDGLQLIFMVRKVIQITIYYTLSCEGGGGHAALSPAISGWNPGSE